MSRPKANQAQRTGQGRTARAAATAEQQSGLFAALLPNVVLGTLAALLVLGTLVPSEGAVRGSGALLAALWMILLVLVHWRLWQVPGTVGLRCGLADGLVLGLAAWIACSALLMAQMGNARSTLNSLWQWSAIFAAYWACRQGIRSASQIRTLLAIMISVSVGLSAHSMYQFFVGMPHNIAHYYQSTEPEKQRILLESGVDPAPHSPLRRNFEDRLRSTEPTATFGLANSLAGVLATWLLLLLAVLFEPGMRVAPDSRPRIIGSALLAAAAILMLAALLLTKSRSAWLALVCGLMLLGVAYRRALWRPRIILPAVVVMVAAIGFGVFSGALDQQVITEARLSLSYRLQYWQAALQMTAAHPWLGVGVGNFQDYYSQFKSPVASETIADPHNFLLELSAAAGIPAALLLLAALAAGLLTPRRKQLAPNQPSDLDGVTDSSMLLYMGALVGTLLSVAYGIVMDLPVETDPYFGWPVVLSISLPAAAVILIVLHRSGFATNPTQVSAGPLVIAVLVMLINLLAAGGISYLAVSQTLWMLLALALNSRDDRKAGGRPLANSIALAVSALLLIACFVTGYAPVLKSRALLAEAAEKLQLRDEMGAREARESAVAAAAADRWSADPWQLLAQLDLQRALEQQTIALERFEDDVRAARSRNPRSQALEMTSGIQYLLAYQRGGYRRGLNHSLAALERAAVLYPNSNYIHAQLAWVAHLAGQAGKAGQHAARALQLDAVNPHWEQQLRQRRIEDFRSPETRPAGEPDPADTDAEQITRWLRNRYQPSSPN